MHKLVVNNPLDSATIIRPLEGRSHPLPIFPLAAGYSVWPSAAQDYLQEELDLNKYLIGNRKASVFLFRIGGHSMRDAGILHDDVIIVDCSLPVSDGHIIVASLFGQFTCKYYRKTNKGVWLQAANPEFNPIKITEEMEFRVFGRYDGLARVGNGRNHEPFQVPQTED